MREFIRTQTLPPNFRLCSKTIRVTTSIDSLNMINSLPSSLNTYVSRIEAVISLWPIKISMDHAIRWILQFDAEDYSLAVKIIENMDVLGTKDIRDSLEAAHAKLARKISEKGTPVKGNNTLYAGIGDAAKSGGLIAYHYRVTVDIPEEDFFSGEEEEYLDLSQIENIVLVDDVIGTGRTIAKEVTRIAEEVYALSRTRNIFVLTVAGYEDGMQHVIEKTGATVVSALEYSTKDTVANLDADFYCLLPMSERTAALDRIKRYCRSISTSELGYGGVGGLLVFDHNTPNTTLPIIWHKGKGWLPLFPRAAKIPRAAKVLKGAEDERKKQQISVESVTDQSPSSKSIELTLFVEGKIDEIFIDYMRQKRELAENIKVAEVNAIALGGLYQSSRLLELLRASKKYAVFILDDDEHTRRASNRLSALPEDKILYLKPSFIAMLDLEKLFTNRDRFSGLPEQFGTVDDPKWLHEIEMAVLKRGPIGSNSERIMQVIDEFLDQKKYDEFTNNLKALVPATMNK